MTPGPNSYEIYNLGIHFLGHYCLILNLSDPCPNVDRKKRRLIACLLYDHAPALGVMKLSIWWTFLGHHYYTINLSDLCLVVEKK